MPVRVVYEGKPLAGLDLHAGYSGQAGQASHLVTDLHGQAVISLSHSGRWYVREIHLVQVDTASHSYESYWATLTFEVAG